MRRWCVVWPKRCRNSVGSRSRRSILAPSERALAGCGCVSINMPLAPTAMAARPRVSISSGCPPVTPLLVLGCCSECVMSIMTGHPHCCCITGMPRISTTRSPYPSIVPRSVTATASLPLCRTFSTAKCIDSGARNCPFLMLTILPVCAAATSRSVWRHRNAGICRISTYSAAMAASAGRWMSVTTGMPKVSRTFASMRRAFSSPMPWNESRRLRLALR